MLTLFDDPVLHTLARDRGPHDKLSGPARNALLLRPHRSQERVEHLIMSLVSFLASLGMAVGPPCVYLDQYFNIIRRKDSTGFSMDVCSVLVSRIALLVVTLHAFSDHFASCRMAFTDLVLMLLLFA